MTGIVKADYEQSVNQSMRYSKGMQRYDFASKWASIVTGIGAVFVTIGLLTFVQLDFIFNRLPLCASVSCPRVGVAPIQTAGFGILFYGCMFIIIGITILFLHRMRNSNQEETKVLETELD